MCMVEYVEKLLGVMQDTPAAVRPYLLPLAAQDFSPALLGCHPIGPERIKGKNIREKWNAHKTHSSGRPL